MMMTTIFVLFTFVFVILAEDQNTEEINWLIPFCLRRHHSYCDSYHRILGIRVCRFRQWYCFDCADFNWDGNDCLDCDLTQCTKRQHPDSPIPCHNVKKHDCAKHAGRCCADAHTSTCYSTTNRLVMPNGITCKYDIPCGIWSAWTPDKCEKNCIQSFTRTRIGEADDCKNGLEEFKNGTRYDTCSGGDCPCDEWSSSERRYCVYDKTHMRCSNAGKMVRTGTEDCSPLEHWDYQLGPSPCYESLSRAPCHNAMAHACTAQTTQDNCEKIGVVCKWTGSTCERKSASELASANNANLVQSETEMEQSAVVQEQSAGEQVFEIEAQESGNSDIAIATLVLGVVSLVLLLVIVALVFSKSQRKGENF